MPDNAMTQANESRTRELAPVPDEPIALAAGLPTSAADTHPAPEAPPAANAIGSSPARLRRLAWLIFSVILVAAGTGVAWYSFGHHGSASVSLAAFEMEEDEEGTKPTSISVNTVRPVRKTLERVLTQPGTVRPEAQAELYAKTSGYLKSIQRDATPGTVAALAGQVPVVSLGCGGLASLAVAAQVEFLRAPQKDIGSHVRAGEPLLEIASPEQHQAVAERESMLAQRLAELEQARTVVGTAEASVDSVKAQQAQAAADVRRAEAEHTFRTAELGRLRELARSRTINAELVDEKQFQVNATAAAIDSSRAKQLAAQTDLAVITSKLATARADLRVKEALVRVARDAVTQAQILASYAVLVAPFDGVITQRGIDEGDFVQNSSSGQTRTLMTISAIDRVKVVLQAPAADAVWIEVGAAATLDVDARTGWHARGRVARTTNVLDPQSRTLHVEIDLDNRSHKLLPGMYGTVTLTLQRIEGALALPATAVYSRGGRNVVMEVRDGIARRVPVLIRFDDGKEVEVVKLIGSGEVPLDGTEELVISNKGELADGQRVSTHPLAASE